MIRTKARWRLAIALTVLNLGFIWINSLLPAEVSASLSRIVRLFLNGLFQDGSAAGGDETVGAVRQQVVFIRKAAHMLEFATLGIGLRWIGGMVWRKNWKAYVLPLLGGFLAGCVDEIIQCFVPGRAPAVLDVGIDAAGVLLGVVFLSAANYLIHLEENKHEKNRGTVSGAGNGGNSGGRMRKKER